MTITTYAALQDALAKLPSPAPDRIRVFRGQNKDYPTFVPSGLRQSIRNEAIWQAYCQHLHREMAPEVIDETGRFGIDALKVYGLWLHAVAQHYGPGSDFVDVTHALDVALWFALHNIEEVCAEGVIGPPGDFDPERDHMSIDTLYRYRPWDESAYLYVFDLPKWNGESLGDPGVVVDLADAPAVFSSSPRLRAQHGCLVYCRNKDSTPLDLKSCLVEGAPLKISLPMSGTPGLERTVAEMFPSPEVDEWYARLLCVPMTYSPTQVPPKLERSIPVSIYLDEANPKYMEEVLYCGVSLPRPLLHRSFGNFSREKEKPTPIPLILEAPMVLITEGCGRSSVWS